MGPRRPGGPPRDRRASGWSDRRSVRPIARGASHAARKERPVTAVIDPCSAARLLSREPGHGLQPEIAGDIQIAACLVGPNRTQIVDVGIDDWVLIRVLFL